MHPLLSHCCKLRRSSASRAGSKLLQHGRRSLHHIHSALAPGWTNEAAWRTPEFQESLNREEESYRDPRVRGVYALAPGADPNFIPASLADIERPARIVVGETDDQAGLSVNAGPISRAIPDAELWVIPKAGHYVFLANCGALGKLLVPLLCRDTATVNRSEIHTRVANDAAQQFKGVLDTPFR